MTPNPMLQIARDNKLSSSNKDAEDLKKEKCDILNFHNVQTHSSQELLNTLNLSRNQLDELPDGLSDLKHLESLDVSYNDLKSLPLSYTKLQRLKYLNLCGNKFKSMPECIMNGMGTLKVFNISENTNAKVNMIPCSKFLEKFLANNNQRCCTFPDWIFSSKFLNLKELELDKTQFDVYNFTSSRRVLCIKKLSISCSNLSTPVLEMMIEYMNSLENLNVGNEKVHEKGNVFNGIPIHIFKHPERITEINFRGTNLSTISESIQQLCNLKILDIGMNCISWFPAELCELKELQSLKIDGNGLIMLPENIGNLRSLQELRVEHNALLRLPTSFKNLNNLKLLDLYDNIFEEVPDVLVNMSNLQSLDLEQNFIDTTNMKFRDTLYSTLRQNYMAILMENDKNVLLYRFTGFKQQTPIEKDMVSEDISWLPSFSSDDESSENISKVLISEVDENWDSTIDTDDEYDPEVVATTTNRNVNSRKYSHVYGPANKFCPADLHTNNVKKEVASMIAFGSLPSFKEEEGQFDDA